MPKITIRNVPDRLHERLKQRAAQNRRSLNSELLAVLENAVGASTQEKRQIHEEIAGNPRRPPLADDPQTLKQKYRKGLE
jgi:plasmid stability protein